MAQRLLSQGVTISPMDCRSGGFAVGVIQLVAAVAGLPRAEVGPDVIGELGQHLVRYFPLGLAQPLLDEAIDGNANQLKDGAQRQVKFVEHGFARLQQTHHLGHELIDHALHLPYARASLRLLGPLELDQPLDVRSAEGGNLLPKLADLVEAIYADGGAPTTARGGVPNLTGTVPAVVRVRHQAALEMTAGPDRAQRPMRDIQGDHLGSLVRRTLDKTGRKRLRIGTFVSGSGGMSLSRPPRPDRDRLRAVADPLIRKQILEVGAYRPVGDSKSPRDLFIGQSCGR